MESNPYLFFAGFILLALALDETSKYLDKRRLDRNYKSYKNGLKPNKKS